MMSDLHVWFSSQLDYWKFHQKCYKCDLTLQHLAHSNQWKTPHCSNSTTNCFESVTRRVGGTWSLLRHTFSGLWVDSDEVMCLRDWMNIQSWPILAILVACQRSIYLPCTNYHWSFSILKQIYLIDEKNVCGDNWTHLNDVWPLLQSQNIDVQSKETE